MNQEMNLFILNELLTSSSDDSEDEELLGTIFSKWVRRAIGKVKNFQTEVMDQYDDKEFQKHFRLKRSTFNILVNLFETSEHYPRSQCGKSTKSPKTHIAVFLWFAGNKTSLRVVGQIFDCSISTTFTIMERVIAFLRSIGKRIIKFPTTEEEMNDVQTNFAEIAGFPGVLGCLDGTYIHIRTPKHKLKSTYINRHDQTSITLQAICDSRKRFLDVFTGISSKMHDASVYRLSFIRNSIENLQQRYHILGDSAYPISPHLLTPYRDYGVLTEQQKNYNYRFSKTRVKIENSFGLLKSRFRQLQHTEFWGIEKTSAFVISCCILHNLCIDNHDYFEERIQDDIVHVEENVILVNERELVLKRLGELKRDNIAAELVRD